MTKIPQFSFTYKIIIANTYHENLTTGSPSTKELKTFLGVNCPVNRYVKIVNIIAIIYGITIFIILLFKKSFR